MPIADARPDLSIVLPVFNEASRIAGALDELLDWLASESADLGWPPRSCEVVVVDDGSSDDTVPVIEAHQKSNADDWGAAAALRVIQRPHAGKGAAVTAGILAADGRLIVFADADMATPPSQLPLLVDALQTVEVALGSRIHPDGSDRRASQPRHRRVLGRLFHLAARLWVTGDVPDTQCGFKGFRREAARSIFSRVRTNGIVFDTEVIYIARRLGYGIAIVPVMWRDVRGSRMRVRPASAVSVLWDLIRIPFLHRSVCDSDQ